MSKRTRQYIGILFAIVAYYIVHEGAHLIVALALHAFKKINFMGIGIQIDIYRDRLTDMQLGIFCIAGVTATLITAYEMVEAIRDTLDCNPVFHGNVVSVNQMIGIMMGSIAVFGIIYYVVTLLPDGEGRR